MDTMFDTVWLLDVDGPINATRPGWSAAPRSGTVYAAGTGWRFRWSPTLIDRIRAVHAAGRTDVRWCSTWCPYATQLERLFGLPPLRRALRQDPVPTGAGGDAVKVAVARQVRADGLRLIWTDDTAVPAFGPLYDELVADGRGLLIRPSARLGLRPGDLDAIDAFVGLAVPGPTVAEKPQPGGLHIDSGHQLVD